MAEGCTSLFGLFCTIVTALERSLAWIPDSSSAILCLKGYYLFEQIKPPVPPCQPHKGRNTNKFVNNKFLPGANLRSAFSEIEN